MSADSSYVIRRADNIMPDKSSLDAVRDLFGAYGADTSLLDLDYSKFELPQ
jgi:hypothetical protein